MSEKPILFSGPMVRAILDGRKTRTRRVVTKETSEVGTGLPWGKLDWSRCYPDRGFGPQWEYLKVGGPDETLHRVRCRIGQPGDRLWVRETIRIEGERTRYTADDSPAVWSQHHITPSRLFEWSRREIDKGDHAIPSIHMPRWVSRITLEITEVRVERLQAITADDARAEGVAECDTPGHDDCFYGVSGQAYQCAFQTLWDSLNADRGYGWDANPWVWVIAFNRVEDSGRSRQGEAR